MSVACAAAAQSSSVVSSGVMNNLWLHTFLVVTAGLEVQCSPLESVLL